MSDPKTKEYEDNSWYWNPGRESSVDETSIRMEVLSLIAAYQDFFHAPIDRATLEWFLGKGIESGCDEPWVRTIVRGFPQKISRALGDLHDYDIIVVSIKGYTITDRGNSELDDEGRNLAWRIQSFWAADFLKQQHAKEQS